MSFLAQFQGACGKCFGEVKDQLCEYEGDEIVHLRCPKVVICDRCFLAKPCECDEED